MSWAHRNITRSLPVVISVDLHLAQVNSVVTEDSGLVNVRRRLLSLEPAPGLLIITPELVRTKTGTGTATEGGRMSNSDINNKDRTED